MTVEERIIARLQSFVDALKNDKNVLGKRTNKKIKRRLKKIVENV
jgi:hypothetical protein